MNHKIKYVVLLILILLCGCSSKSTDPYISYTQTKSVNDKLTSAIYYYDFKQNPIKVYEFEYNSGYPIGVYDKTNGLVFYTQKIEGETHLLKYHMNTKKVESITTRTSAVNELIPIKDNKLFIVSYDKEDKTNVMYPFVYDIKSNEVKKIVLDPLISINDVKYDAKKDEFYVSGWLRADEEKLLQQKEGYNIPLKRNIYTMKLSSNKLNLVYEGESEFDAFGVDFKNNAIIVKDKTENNIRYEINLKKRTENNLPEFQSITWIENENIYYVGKHLYRYQNNQLIPISKFDSELEAVNNAVYVVQ